MALIRKHFTAAQKLEYAKLMVHEGYSNKKVKTYFLKIISKNLRLFFGTKFLVTSIILISLNSILLAYFFSEIRIVF